MGKTCCLASCKSNYRSEVKTRTDDETISVYRFPHAKRFPRERERWIEVASKITKDLNVNDNTVICSRHWPANAPMFNFYGKDRPVNPPSIFEDIPPSIVPTPPPPARTTTRTSCHQRNQQEDEITAFRQRDRFTFESLKETLASNTKQFSLPFQHLLYGDSITLLSNEFYEGIPYYMIKIKDDLRFDTYHLGSKVYISPLITIRASKMNSWSRLEEALRFLNQREVDHKTEILQQQFEMKRATPIAKKVYSPAVIVRAFEYYCTSRSLYSKLRHDYNLPSIRTLQRLTSKVGKLNETGFPVGPDR